MKKTLIKNGSLRKIRSKGTVDFLICLLWRLKKLKKSFEWLKLWLLLRDIDNLPWTFFSSINDWSLLKCYEFDVIANEIAAAEEEEGSANDDGDDDDYEEEIGKNFLLI